MKKLIIIFIYIFIYQIQGEKLTPDPFSVDNLQIKPPTHKSTNGKKNKTPPKKLEDKKTKQVEKEKKVNETDETGDKVQTLLKELEQKEAANLRSETAKVEPVKTKTKEKGSKKTGKDETEDVQEMEDEKEQKKDAILDSIEGAEKTLSEAFGAVKSRIQTLGAGQKPIKVDCGTTRVRVVCTKKNKEGEEASENSENSENSEGSGNVLLNSDENEEPMVPTVESDETDES